jgi:hypothetical protein
MGDQEGLLLRLRSRSVDLLECDRSFTITVASFHSLDFRADVKARPQRFASKRHDATASLVLMVGMAFDNAARAVSFRATGDPGLRAQGAVVARRGG